jgi:hypothetical protein
MGRTRNLLLILTIILFLPLFIRSISQGPQKSKWLGIIEYEDGVKVIKNPREPLYGEIEFDLEEDLSIGNEEDENCYFYKSIAMEVDSKGNIYVMDHANYRVQKFDKNGNFVLTIGRQGLGPGEFQRMHGLHLDNRERICVLDRRMIHIFNTNGEFEDCINLKNNISQYSFAGKENIICRVSGRSDEGIEEEIVLLNREGNHLKSYVKSLLPVFRKKASSIIGGGPYNPRLYFCPWLKGSAIYGHSSEYRLFFIDFSGEVTFIAEIAKPPEVITKKERNEFYKNEYESEKIMNPRFPDRKALSMNEIKQAYPLPKNKPFFMKFFTDEAGNVYVFVMPDLYTKEKYVEFDLFNRQGYYFYRIRMALLPRVIKGGYVYRDRWDEERGFCKIKRYKIKNWDQIKTGM